MRQDEWQAKSPERKPWKAQIASVVAARTARCRSAKRRNDIETHRVTTPMPTFIDSLDRVRERIIAVFRTLK